MTPEQVTLVQQTFALVVPVADKAAETFYGRLFDIAPAVKPLFRGDMTEQRHKLMATLAVVVRGLSDLPSILPAASALAKRHVDYGAKPEHYPAVGEALLWTLARALGPPVDSGGRVGVDGRLYDVVRVYDRRGIWSAAGGRVMLTPPCSRTPARCRNCRNTCRAGTCPTW